MSAQPLDSAVLAELYEGPLQEPPWESFLALIREWLGADLVTLLLRPPSLERQAVMLADGGSLEAMRSYNEGQFTLDPFVDLPDGQVITLHEYFGGDALFDSEFYRVILAPQGWHDFIGMDLRREGEFDVRFRAGRYRGKAAFGDAERARIESLRSHLERSIRLHGRIHRSEQERAVYAGAVEQLQVATIILDEEGEVLSTNSAADALLQKAEALSVSDKRLRLVDRDADATLLSMLERVGRAPVGELLPAEAMQVPCGNSGGVLGLVARAVPAVSRVEGKRSPCIAVFINNPELSAEPPVTVIGRLFDLTPTEATLSVLLSNGCSLDEASMELNISRNTARAHLRSVFAKTGVTRQSGLVRLVLRSVAPLAGNAPAQAPSKRKN